MEAEEAMNMISLLTDTIATVLLLVFRFLTF